MSTGERPNRRCFLALPHSQESLPVREAVRKGVQDAGFEPVPFEETTFRPGIVQDILLGELAGADCVIADLTGRSSNVFYEAGAAQAMGKGLFLLIQEGLAHDVPFDLRGLQLLAYQPTPAGLRTLSKTIATSLKSFRRFPRPRKPIPSASVTAPFFVEWERLERSDSENLCRELLAQLGYQRLDWWKESPEIDLVAELPKRDPDGFEYRELWLISMGRNAPVPMVLEMAAEDPRFLFRRLMRHDDRLERRMVRGSADSSVTLLLIILEARYLDEEFDLMRKRMESRLSKLPSFPSLRVRIWDQNYLTSLVQQFPHIGYKYFSEEGRARSKYRKTPEELYRENVDLANRQATLIAAYEEEKNRRVRAERDAVWKDISFSAAHKIGNPVFAIETDLDPLERRVRENRQEEAVHVVSNIRASVEKAKAIVDQFKSLTKAQQITPVRTLLFPLLDDACNAARNKGVECTIECSPDISVHADPERLAECFDELVANAMHWFDKSEKRIVVQVAQPAPAPLPSFLDSSGQYVLIRFKDNGQGVPIQDKTSIFEAFFTKYDHGTGLGLALVRRVIEGHGGAVVESGIPGQGADFEIYLPAVDEASDTQPASARRRKRRPKEEAQT